MQPPESSLALCGLCERAVNNLTVHHLVPRSQAKKGQVIPTVNLCSACHRQLHAMFSNQQLARELASLESLKQEPSIQKFLCWVRKQDANKRIKVRR